MKVFSSLFSPFSIFGLILLCLASLTAPFRFPNALINKQASSGFQRRMNLFAQLGIVTMYKKEGCPFCAKAIDLLENKHHLNITYVDIQNPDP